MQAGAGPYFLALLGQLTSSRIARKITHRAHRGRKPPLRFFADHRSQIKYAKLAALLIGRRELHAEGGAILIACGTDWHRRFIQDAAKLALRFKTWAV